MRPPGESAFHVIVLRVSGCSSLRHRSRRVLGEGLSNARIAARLFRSEAGVKGYVSRMLDELGCANRAQAGLLARDAPGIVSP